jgi:hypothetical protein
MITATLSKGAGLLPTASAVRLPAACTGRKAAV